MPVAPDDDDDLDDLPPIDGDGGDAPDLSGKFDDVPSADDDTEADTSLDDTTAEDDPTDAEELDTDADEGENGWLEEPIDSSELDVGDGALFNAGDETAAFDDSEDPAVGDEDFGIGEGGEGSGTETAEEGPVDPDEELRDADLPALDADDPDDDDSPEDSGLLDERVAGDEPLGLPWAAEPWVAVGTSWAGVSGVTAIARAAGGALVAGRSESRALEFMRLDLEGGRRVLAAAGLESGDVRSLAVEGDTVAVVSQNGKIFRSDDGGEHFEALALTGNVAAVDVVLASGVLWARTRTGSLLAARRGKAVERCPVPGTVAALTGDGDGNMAALALDEGTGAATFVRSVATSATDDGAVAVVCEAIEWPAGRSPARMVARGNVVAVATAAARGGVVRRNADGAWQRFAWDGRISAIALVDDAGTLLAATYSDTDDTSALVRVDATGKVTLAARVGPAREDPESDGRVVAMAWDPAHEVVWVAGAFGVAAFATP